ncbi:prosaposin-like isoform X1 [Gordionus sp. m RMFG-2023]|uniref:prosaposin-like isoform X1 n=1 Tax=Gordionus sp. m RMFG-2023 TaxID=3053472 RepID=UPI0031FC9B9F
MAYSILVFILSSTFIYANENYNLYSDCSQGPSYWCKNLTNTKRCGALNHCADLWNNQKNIESSPNEDCQFCMFLISDVKEMVKNFADEADIRKKITESCELIKNFDLFQKCKTIANELYYSLIVLLHKDISPFWICDSIHLCNSTKEFSLMNTYKLSNDEISHFNPLDEIHTEDISIISLFNDKLDKIILGGSEDVDNNEQNLKGDPESLTIDSTIHEHHNALNNPWATLIASSVYQNIAEDENLLAFIFTDIHKNVIQAGVQDDSLCEMCRKGTRGLDRLLQEKSFQEDLIKYIDGFCMAIPSIEEKIMCKEGMKKVIPDILKMIDGMLKASNICVKAQICTPQLMFNMGKKGINRTNLCNDCKKVIDQVRGFISKTQDNVMDSAKHVCQAFPVKVQEKCSSIVRNYIPAVYEYINMLIDPVQMCQAFGICSSSGDNVKPVNEMKMSDAMELAKSFLIQGTPLFSPFIHKVNTFAEKEEIQNNEIVWKDLLRFARVESNSVKSGEDFYKAVKISDLPGGLEPNSVECKICEQVVTVLLEKLGNNRTRENIRHWLDKICSVMPSTLGKDCRAFVDMYSETLMILLQNNMNSSQICQAFDFCQIPNPPPVLSENASYHILDMDSPTVYAAPVRNFDYCPVCHIAVAWLSQKIGKNSTDEQIMEMAKRFCSELPGKWNKECLDYLDMYGVQALKLISEYMDPEVVCQQLGMCQSKRIDILYTQADIDNQNKMAKFHLSSQKSETKRQLAGSNVCTRGPGYWCQNMQTAKECDAIKYCQERGWSTE